MKWKTVETIPDLGGEKQMCGMSAHPSVSVAAADR